MKRSNCNGALKQLLCERLVLFPQQDEVANGVLNLDTGRLYAYPPQEIVDTTDDDAGEESKEESEKDDDPEVEEDA